MMDDRELLKLAARSAGLMIWEGRNTTGLHPAMNALAAPKWNPLMDDGDAFRLAVKLGLPIKRDKWNSGVRYVSCHRTWHCNDSLWYDEGVSLDDGDEFAATRRAIVRAAAEMAR